MACLPAPIDFNNDFCFVEARSTDSDSRSDGDSEAFQSTLVDGLSISSPPNKVDKGMNTEEQSLPPSQKMACECAQNARNLVVCIDGTSNQFGKMNTNVIELYSLIPKGNIDNQRTYYNSGIGTYARPSWRSWAWYKQVLGHKVDLAIAWNFERIVLDAYRWLSETHKEGDCIFLFGFSRGAYQIRVLSAMIDKVGLIHRGNEAHIPFAYQLYADYDDSLASTASDANLFKKTFSRDVKVHFVGAWDTVSSIGIVRERKLLPGTIDGMKHVCYFRHALALDERRVKFLPEYAYGGAALPSRPNAGSQTNFNDTKEVWFAGTHSDIGGGNEVNEKLDRTRPSLRWMFSEAFAAGLRLIPFQREFKDAEEVVINESLNVWWRPFERLPFRRLTYAATKDDDPWIEDGWIGFEVLAWILWTLVGLSALVWQTLRHLTGAVEIGLEFEKKGQHDCTISWPPHRGKGRIIQVGQKIHPSVWRLKGLGTAESVYTPRARPPASEVAFWLTVAKPEDLKADGTYSNPWKEVDLYDLVGDLVVQYTNHEEAKESDGTQGAQLDMIRMHALSTDGRRAQLRALVERLRRDTLVQSDILCNVLRVLVAASDPHSDITMDERGVDMWGYLLRHLGSAFNDLARRFMESFAGNPDVILQDLIKQYTDYESVTDDEVQHAQLMTMSIYASSVEGRRALIRTLVKRLKQEQRIPVDILCNIINVLVTVPHSDPETINEPHPGMWPHVLRHVGAPAIGSQRPIARRVMEAFAGDSDEIVEDLVKQYTTYESVTEDDTQRALLETIHDYATTADDRRTLLCNLAQRLQFVRSDKREPDRKPVEGQVLCSVLRVILESSNDDHETRLGLYTIVRFRMLRHLNGINGDERRIAQDFLGKFTDTVQVLTGHTYFVFCVAFSADGTRIVSGSWDHTIRIWDAETGQAVGKPLEGHTWHVMSVAFSPDSARIVSGSDDRTVRIWDAETGQAVGKPLKGHTGSVRSVAFSLDGTRIASGSSDNTIRIWDAETGQAVGKPLEGHAERVFSVAFSPDGMHIVSGSSDKTIRVWDAETGQAVGKPLEGHTGTVSSVAFSPDGTRIVSGSGDGTVRIWDAETGQAVGKPLEGHTDWVLSVAFSPDGTRIVSGSQDNTVRIWDVLQEPV